MAHICAEDERTIANKLAREEKVLWPRVNNGMIVS